MVLQMYQLLAYFWAKKIQQPDRQPDKIEEKRSD
jgi:hypothetical protein